MFGSSSRRNAALAALGGLAWVAIRGLDGVVPYVYDAAVVVPVLLGFGVLEVYCRYDDAYGTTGRAGVVLLSLGLAGAFVGAVLWATLPPVLIRIFVVGVPAVAGVVLVAVGSGLLAIALSRIGVLRWPTALLFGVAVPLTPLVDGLLTPVIGVGVALYGLAWVPVAYRLWVTTGEAVDPVAPSSRGVVPGPQAVVAGIAGAALLIVGLVGSSPGGPVGRLPLGGNHSLLIALYLVTGAVGLAAGAAATAGLGPPGVTRAYNVVVGGCYLLLAVATVGGMVVVGAAPLADLALTDAFLYLPVGVVLAAVGIAVGADEDRRPDRTDSGATAE